MIRLGILVERMVCVNGRVVLDERWCSWLGWLCPRFPSSLVRRCRLSLNPHFSKVHGIWGVKRLNANCSGGSQFDQAIGVAGAVGCSQMRQLFALVRGLLEGTSACWIWFALSMTRCWVDFRILGNLKISSKVETMICTSLKIHANSGRFSIDTAALGCRVMLFSYAVIREHVVRSLMVRRVLQSCEF